MTVIDFSEWFLIKILFWKSAMSVRWYSRSKSIEFKQASPCPRHEMDFRRTGRKLHFCSTWRWKLLRVNPSDSYNNKRDSRQSYNHDSTLIIILITRVQYVYIRHTKGSRHTAELFGPHNPRKQIRVIK